LIVPSISKMARKKRAFENAPQHPGDLWRGIPLGNRQRSLSRTVDDTNAGLAAQQQRHDVLVAVDDRFDQRRVSEGFVDCVNVRALANHLLDASDVPEHAPEQPNGTHIRTHGRTVSEQYWYRAHKIDWIQSLSWQLW